MFGFVLMAIIGIVDQTIPLNVIIMRAFGAIGIFLFLGKIFSNIGRDLFREAINDSKNKRDEQAEATRNMLESDTGLTLDDDEEDEEQLDDL
jgi:hypothetical protein